MARRSASSAGSPSSGVSQSGQSAIDSVVMLALCLIVVFRNRLVDGAIAIEMIVDKPFAMVFIATNGVVEPNPY